MKQTSRHAIDPLQRNIPFLDRVRFHCRFTREMFRFYRTRRRGLSKTIRLALRGFRDLAEKGAFKPPRTSQFLDRADITDKTERYVSLTATDKDLIEKLAFTFHTSQAEVLRIAMEWYMTQVPADDTRMYLNAHLRKKHHRRPLLRPVSMSYQLWEPGRTLEWKFPENPGLPAP